MINKKIITIAFSFIFLFLILFSCQNVISENNVNNKINCISSKVNLMKANHLFENLDTKNKDCSTSEQDSELEKVKEFIQNPTPALVQISDEDKGEEKIDLVYSIVNEETKVEDIIDKMENIDPQMAGEFSSSIDTENSKLFNKSNSKISNYYDYKNLKLKIFSMSNNKGILVSDFSWNTVICYAGINATTIAGYLIYKYSCCFSWTKWVGLAVAIAGSASAAYQIYLWYNKCEEIIGMVAFANNLEYIWNQGRFLLNASSLEDAIKWAAQYIKNNYPEIYNHGLDGKNVDWNKFLRDFFAYDQINNAISYIRNFNIDFGERLIVTAGSTGITAVICKKLYIAAIQYWNCFAYWLKSSTGISWILFGIPIEPIHIPGII
ncbi:MAG TPA: hypothetical protein PK520_02550 [Exilispira sp.]|nr:hypothetical protein [Exilispira sp.]